MTCNWSIDFVGTVPLWGANKMQYQAHLTAYTLTGMAPLQINTIVKSFFLLQLIEIYDCFYHKTWQLLADYMHLIDWNSAPNGLHSDKSVVLKYEN